MTSEILSVGSMGFDSVRTPSGEVDSVLGGSVNYFSVAASFFSPVKIVAVVGKDFPKSHLDWLKTRKIDVQGVDITQGETFRWIGEYSQDMNEAKTLSTQLNVLEHFNPKLSSALKKCPYVFLGNIDPTLQESIMDQAESPEIIACDTMNFWITGKPSELKKTLKRVDILSINEGEARLLSGQKNLQNAADFIRAMGPSVLIIKRGEYGAALFTPKGTYLVPAFPSGKVVDPTGAGDSFAGAFMGVLAKMHTKRSMLKKDTHLLHQILRKAVISGCVMASFTIEDFSLNRIMHLEKSEFEAREKLFLEMIHPTD